MQGGVELASLEKRHNAHQGVESEKKLLDEELAVPLLSVVDSSSANNNNNDGDSNNKQQESSSSSSSNKTGEEMPSKQQMSSFMKILLYGGGVFGFYVIHDYIQEMVFHRPGFEFGWFMTLFEMGLYVIFSVIKLQMSGYVWRDCIPYLKHYCVLGLLIQATQGFGTAAIAHVNYPVKVVMKSCKLIPTMVFGLFIGRRYNAMEYIAAVLLCIGVVSFLLVDAAASPKFHIIGIIFLLIAVVGDALTANSQELTLKRFNRSQSEMIAIPNGIGTVIVIIVCFVNGEMLPAINLCVKDPSIVALLLLQSLSAYVGVGFYLSLIEHFGGATAVTVTTCRKVATITLSFLAFSKPFDVRYIPAGTVLVLGIWLSARAKNSHRPKRENEK